MPGSLKRAKGTEASGIADFVTVRVEANAAVVRQDLRVQFRVLIAQDDVVEGVDSSNERRVDIANLVFGDGAP